MVQQHNFTRKSFLLIAFVTLTSLSTAAQTSPKPEDVLFEGYYQILSGNAPVGFIIQREVFDRAKKEYRTTYFIRTSSLGGNLMESADVFSNDKFAPLKYSYSSLMQKTEGEKPQTEVKTIDAVFSAGKMKMKVSTGSSAQETEKKLSEGSFLSSALGYFMLNKGFKVGTRYTYSGIAEEDGQAYAGDAFIKETATYKGVQVFKILNTFKGVKFISFVTPEGQVLATESPVQGISTQLFPSKEVPTKGVSFDEGPIKKLFGEVPKGEKNIFATPLKKEPAPKTGN